MFAKVLNRLYKFEKDVVHLIPIRWISSWIAKLSSYFSIVHYVPI